MPLSRIPSVIQLPGGVRLNGVYFKCIEHDADGHPVKFEIMPPGERGDWVLFADERVLRSAVKRKEDPNAR